MIKKADELPDCQYVKRCRLVRHYREASKKRDLLEEAVWIVKNGILGEHALGAFSGGKDSIVLHRVCEIAGLRNLEWHYHKTTIDPPEVCHYIKKHYPHVVWDRPKHGNFFRRAMQKNVMPSAKCRWCCDEYKESRGPLNTVWIVGERREESLARSSQPVIGLHRRTRRVLVRPLANWTEEDVWDFIRSEKLSYPSLYDEGFGRLGCIGCPLASRKSREREFARWPKYRDKWIALARHVYESRAPWEKFTCFEDYFEAWMDRRI